MVEAQFVPKIGVEDAGRGMMAGCNMYSATPWSRGSFGPGISDSLLGFAPCLESGGVPLLQFPDPWESD